MRRALQILRNQRIARITGVLALCGVIGTSAWFKLPGYSEISHPVRVERARQCFAGPAVREQVAREQRNTRLLRQAGAPQEPPAWLKVGVLGLTRTLGLPFEVHVAVISSNQLNAHATIDGGIYVTAELLKVGLSQPEVLAVVAHEVGHVARQDAVWQKCLSLNELAFDRQGAELEADRYAVRALANAGLNPEALSDALSKLSARTGEGSSDSHPALRLRIEAAQRLAGMRR